MSLGGHKHAVLALTLFGRRVVTDISGIGMYNSGGTKSTDRCPYRKSTEEKRGEESGEERGREFYSLC